MTAKSQDADSYRIRLLSVDELRPNERNARKHPADQVEQIAASIREFGFTSPILADLDDDGLIVAGHGRRLAVLKIVEAGEAVRLPNGQALPVGVVPVIDCSGWTEAQRRAYTLADNQLALTSEWDEELLKIELGELREKGFAVDLIGFDATDGFLECGSSLCSKREKPHLFGRAFANTRRPRKLVIADARPAVSLKRQSPSPMLKQSGNTYSYKRLQVNRQ